MDRKIILALMLIIVNIIYFLYGGQRSGSNEKFMLVGKVVKVYDGDTLEVSLFNISKNIRVRLKCIDFPDLKPEERLQKWIRRNSTRERVEHCYHYDNDLVKNLTLGKVVFLVQDKPFEKDKYNRYLAHVYLNTSFNLNKFLIENGYAIPYYCHKYDKYYVKKGCLWDSINMS